MTKKQITFLTTSIILAMIFSGCGAKPAVNEVKKNNNKVVATSTDINSTISTNDTINITSSSIFASSTKDIDTSDWEIYRNKEYGLELRYPKDWHWKDYTNEYVKLKIGFFPPTKEEGWEYNGDIELIVHNNVENLSLDEWYKKIWEYKKPVVDKIENIINKNNQKIIIEYNSPDMFGGSDLALTKCDKNMIYFNAVMRMSTEEMLAMVNEFICKN